MQVTLFKSFFYGIITYDTICWDGDSM